MGFFCCLQFRQNVNGGQTFCHFIYFVPHSRWICCGFTMYARLDCHQCWGSTRIGLLRSCMTLRNRPTECFVQNLTPEWALSLICIFSGCLCLTTTLGLIIVTQWDRSLQQYARWFGFLAVIFFCLAAILFPIGFSINEIGGAPYQLPSNFSVGISYIFFVMSIWITVVSELFVSKICLPHF